MNVKGNGQSIVNGSTTPSAGDHTHFGTVSVAGDQVVRTFTIENTGTAALNLSGDPKVSVSGDHDADFTVTLDPVTPVPSGGSTTFQVTFDPSDAGVRTATLSIANDDADEHPYDFAIQGEGSIPPGVTATGGNTTNDMDGYRIHIFTNSATAGSFVVSNGNLRCDILIVGGGGGGGWNYGGGGGGGSVILTNVTLTSGTNPVVVGIGGATAPKRKQHSGCKWRFVERLFAYRDWRRRREILFLNCRQRGDGWWRLRPDDAGGTGTPRRERWERPASPRIGGGGGGARGNGQAAQATKGGDGGWA